MSTERKSLRLLVVSNMYPSPRDLRYGSFVRDSVEAMRELGADVDVVAVTDSRRGLVRAVAKYAGLLGRTVVTALRSRFDAVHAHFLFPTGLVGWLAAGLRGVPLVLFAHGSDVLFASRGGIIGRATRRSIRAADVLVAPSAALAEEIREALGDCGPRVEVVPMGVDVALFAPGDRSMARRRTGLGDDGSVVLFVGALDGNKGAGCEELMEALDTPVLQEVRLVVVGDGPWRDRLQHRARTGSLVGRVEFRGQVDRQALADLIRAVDLVAVPSRRESLGLVALEARAAGIPVVAAAVGGLRDHVKPGVSGELYQPGDPRRLRDAIVRVLSAPGAYAPPALEDRYTVEGSARTVLEVTAAAVERGASGR